MKTPQRTREEQFEVKDHVGTRTNGNKTGQDFILAGNYEAVSKCQRSGVLKLGHAKILIVFKMGLIGL